MLFAFIRPCVPCQTMVPMLKNRPDFFNAGRNAIYTATDTIEEVTALMEVAAMFHARVISAAGFPRMRSL